MLTLGPDEELQAHFNARLAALWPSDRGKYRELQLTGRQFWVIVEPSILTREGFRVCGNPNEANGTLTITCVGRTVEQVRAVTNEMLSLVVGYSPGILGVWTFGSLSMSLTEDPRAYTGLPEHTTFETVCKFAVRGQRVA